MNAAAWIAILVGGAVAVFAVWLVLLETSIRVEPGTLALLLKRGKATGRAVGPGRHFVAPWSKLTMQVYPSRELVVAAGGPPSTDPRVEYVDDPLEVTLGDRADATVTYTVRCQLDPGELREVHNRFGPEGIWAALRDTIRATLLAELGQETTIDDAFAKAALERRCTKPVKAALGDIGFELRRFTLRDVDLGETGEVVQATIRAAAELDREQALAEVRRARIANDASMSDLLAGADADVMLRYRQIEAWRDLLQRWNGTQPIPPALTAPLVPTAAPLDAHEDHEAAHTAPEPADGTGHEPASDAP